MTLTPTQVARRNVIIKDIVKKRPTENGCTYTTQSEYDYNRGYRRNVIVPSKPFFGYCPLELGELGFYRMNDFDIAHLIRLHFAKAITQKTNRFSERIVCKLRVYINEVGAPGLYKVRAAGNSLGYVHAVNLAEAVRVADVTYGYTVAGKLNRYGDSVRLDVRFNQFGDLSLLACENQKDIDAINSRIEALMNNIKVYQDSVDKLKNDIIAIQMGSINQISYDEDEE
jgi:hypothetical protein